MKIQLLIAAIAVTLFSCSEPKMDLAKAKETAEGCLKTIDKGDYAKVKSDFYSSELGEQSAEELENKFKNNISSKPVNFISVSNENTISLCSDKVISIFSIN